MRSRNNASDSLNRPPTTPDLDRYLSIAPLLRSPCFPFPRSDLRHQLPATAGPRLAPTFWFAHLPEQARFPPPKRLGGWGWGRRVPAISGKENEQRWQIKVSGGSSYVNAGIEMPKGSWCSPSAGRLVSRKSARRRCTLSPRFLHTGRVRSSPPRQNGSIHAMALCLSLPTSVTCPTPGLPKSRCLDAFVTT